MTCLVLLRFKLLWPLRKVEIAKVSKKKVYHVDLYYFYFRTAELKSSVDTGAAVEDHRRTLIQEKTFNQGVIGKLFILDISR